MECSFGRRGGVSVASAGGPQEMENHIEERNFSPWLWAKQGVGNWWLRLWFMLWSPLVSGAVLLLEEGREWSQQPASEQTERQRRKEGLLTNCTVSSRQETQGVFHLYSPCPQLWPGWFQPRVWANLCSQFCWHGWTMWKMCLLFRFEYTLTLKEK